MRTTPRPSTWLARGAALLAFGLLAACGSGGGAGTAVAAILPGPDQQALPVFDDGSFKTLVLRNFAELSAPVKVTTVPGGATTTRTIAPRAELRLPVLQVQGWMVVDTRDPVSGLPIATTGLVEPYLHAQRGGPDEEITPGALLQTVESDVPIHPRTDSVLLLNRGPANSTFQVCEFGPAGGAPLSIVITPLVGVNGFLQLSFPNLAGSTGHLYVTANTPGTVFTTASKEDDDLVYEVDLRTGDHARAADNGLSLGIQLQFGQVNPGQFVDFDLQATNASFHSSAFTLNAITDEFGNPLLTTPRTFTVPPRATRLFATTLVNSLGLAVGEVHPFADKFGDVFAATGLLNLHMDVTVGPDLFLFGRIFDPGTLEFAQREWLLAPRHVQSLLVSDAQTTLSSGFSDTAILVNPTGAPITVNVHAFTEALGTEYVLPDVVVPAHAHFLWSADALLLREVVNDFVSPPVRNFRFRFGSNATFNLFGRREERDGAGFIHLRSPFVVRQED